MAKTPLTLAEEEEQKAKYGGMLLSQIMAADAAIAKQKRESSELSGDLSAAMNLFEKQGGHKAALRMATKCARMEPVDFADFYRCFVAYGKALEIFDEDGNVAQADMFDQQAEQQKNADSIAAATAKAAVAKPSKTMEPSVN